VKPDPTPYPDVNAVLDGLLSDVQTVLGDHFSGMYLYGSLASGDFDPHRSDIDFLVVTTGELPDEIIPALEAMHMRILSSGLKWASKLEGSYLPQHALRRYNPDDPPRPAINEGRFYLDCHRSDWVIQRHIIREHGLTLAGPSPRDLIDPVQPDDLRQAVRGILVEWWSPILHDPARLSTSEYQAFGVLTMCRALHTLQHGIIASKPAAARWAQAALGEPWAALIEYALAWQRDMPWDAHLDQTLDFVRYTLDRARQSEIPADH
jgi:hypothetical protein